MCGRKNDRGATLLLLLQPPLLLLLLLLFAAIEASIHATAVTYSR
jgi:hypothetical protein